MPELPDLVYIEKKLNSFITDKKIIAARIKEPIVLRMLIESGFQDALIESKIEKICRHGPFLKFSFDNDYEMVLHLMLAGKFKISCDTTKPGRGLCWSLCFEDGSTLHFTDDKKMGKVYLIKADDYQQIPKYTKQGVDILSAQFTDGKFNQLIKGQRKQVRVFLMDQTLLSAIGNAYADEILFDARIHPKTFCYQLSKAEIDRLYQSTLKVMQWGIAEVEKAQQPIDVKVRGHLKVRNSLNQPCPRCSTTIRRVGVLGHDSYFCPNCQPASRKQFIDWRNHGEIESG